MDDAQGAKAQEWIAEKVKNPDCPKCGVNSWTASEIVAGAVMRGRDPDLDGNLYPMLLLICDNCAYTEQYAATNMGLIPRSV